MIIYEFNKLTFTSFYIGAEDSAAPVEDAGTLTRKMPNTVSHIIAGYDFSHQDFWAHMDVGKLIYRPIIEEMNEIRYGKSTTESFIPTTSESMSSPLAKISFILISLMVLITLLI